MLNNDKYRFKRQRAASSEDETDCYESARLFTLGAYAGVIL